MNLKTVDELTGESNILETSISLSSKLIDLTANAKIGNLCARCVTKNPPMRIITDTNSITLYMLVVCEN